MSQLKKTKNSFQRGQTLIEVIVATGIISIAFVAILGLIVQSLIVGAESRQRTQATFLAQDVIERILLDRNWNNVRIKQGNSVVWDLNFYDGQDGYYDYGACCYGVPGRPPYDFSRISPPASPMDDQETNLFDYDGVFFTRYIEINNRGGSANERGINVRVNWTTSKGLGEVYLSTVVTKLP